MESGQKHLLLAYLFYSFCGTTLSVRRAALQREGRVSSGADLFATWDCTVRARANERVQIDVFVKSRSVYGKDASARRHFPDRRLSRGRIRPFLSYVIGSAWRDWSWSDDPQISRISAIESRVSSFPRRRGNDEKPRDYCPRRILRRGKVPRRARTSHFKLTRIFADKESHG